MVERLNAGNLTAKLERLLTNANYANFVGLDDKKYSFTKDERELIAKRGQKYFEELCKQVVHQVCQRLVNATRNLDMEANGEVRDDDALAKLDGRIIDLARIVITAQDESETNLVQGRWTRRLFPCIASNTSKPPDWKRPACWGRRPALTRPGPTRPRPISTRR